MYEYKAHVTGVYDAYTITVNIDLGFGIWTFKQKIRLFGIDAPEMRGPERNDGTVSRDWLRDKILDQEIVLKTKKDKTGKFGRWIGDVYLPGESKSLNDQMVDLGLAEVADY
jgi:micrococcal nuclease